MKTSKVAWSFPIAPHNDPCLKNNRNLITTLIPNCTIAIVCANFNSNITHNLLKGAQALASIFGIKTEVYHVPGAVELTYMTKRLLLRLQSESPSNPHAMKDISEYSLQGIVVLGAVVRGESAHFEYVCQSVTHGITECNLLGIIPVIFGVLTTDSLEQAESRSTITNINEGLYTFDSSSAKKFNKSKKSNKNRDAKETKEDNNDDMLEGIERAFMDQNGSYMKNNGFSATLSLVNMIIQDLLLVSGLHEGTRKDVSKSIRTEGTRTQEQMEILGTFVQ